MTDSAVILLVVCILWTLFGVLFLAIVSSQLNRMETKLDMLIEHGHNLPKFDYCKLTSVSDKAKFAAFDERMQAKKDGVV
jgi:hypothetical protein